MERIEIGKSEHRGSAVVTLRFPYHAGVVRAARAIKGLLWSRTLGCWYVEDRASIVTELVTCLQKVADLHFGFVGEEAERVRAEERKMRKGKAQDKPLNRQKEEAVEQLRDFMRSKRYSGATIATYGEALRVFLRYFDQLEIEGHQRSGPCGVQQPVHPGEGAFGFVPEPGCECCEAIFQHH